MMHDMTVVNSSATTAPLRNVSMCMTALDRTVEREPHLPGMVVFYGPSGYGKSTAASFIANRHRAYRVEMQHNWTKKFFLSQILKEMGMGGERGTIPDLVEKICEQLVLSRRPLIIDEMDHVIARNMVPLVGDIYNGSAASIMLIGEEQMPSKLAKWEKFHGRILEWVGALPIASDDARHLRTLYVRRIEIADDLLEHLVRIAEGSARRICVNFDKIEKTALAEGVERMDRKAWGDRPLYTGKAPARRG